MTVAELAQLFSPFVAVVMATGYINTQFGRLREEIARLQERIRFLEQELQEMRARQ